MEKPRMATDANGAPLRFRRWKYDSGLAPSALFELDRSCGIYVLEFANGEQYVGQTVHLPSRLSAHRRHHKDIVAVNFAEVERPRLNAAEYDEIQKRRGAGVRLRNKVLLVQPLGDSPLDTLVDQQAQKDWIDASIEDDAIVIGDRAKIAARRRTSREKFVQLQTSERFDDVLESLAAYVARVIPWPHQTEGRTWTVTALPSTARRSDNRRLATLSINNVEVLFLGEERVIETGGEWVPYTVLNLAPDVQHPADIAELIETGDFYRSTGTISRTALQGFPLAELLDEPSVLLAARRLALGQLRKGASMFSRFHNDSLADAIFTRIDEGLPEF